ncbi:hypothetical protein FB45DRAFT_1053177 [Roridomyces roridus]|uniref:F-box domain-containing protein n=1 Tax=Roridomyces roridus TaxID=1738132 RepID=A0AAD7CDP5_9AGAR|nr:hypothetical protein FB45DRAFT_1053177 [Roridomyces roridus]
MTADLFPSHAPSEPLDSLLSQLELGSEDQLHIVRRLPLDILGEIFNHLRQDTRTIWVLGSVCKTWRAATFSLPAIWSNIERGLPLRVIATHLERSQASALSIHVGPLETTALQLLIPHSPRWDSVKLQMGGSGLALLDQIHGRIPFLRRVDFYDYVARPKVCRAFEIAPRLSEVSLMGSMPLVLPWAQIQRAFIGLQDIDLALQQLQLAVSLVELKLMTFVGVPSSIAHIELPRLRKLFVNNTSLLGVLLCPSLEELFLHDDAESTLVIPFLQQSTCRLRRLTSRTSSAPDILSILINAPSLCELRLTGKCSLPDLLPQLMSHQTDRPLGPELRHLTLNGIKTDDDCVSVVEMMQSRPALSLCVFNYKKGKLSRRGLETLNRFKGFEVEWLTADAAKSRYHSWQDEFPS